jgi:hypothetical protein
MATKKIKKDKEAWISGKDGDAQWPKSYKKTKVER